MHTGPIFDKTRPIFDNTRPIFDKTRPISDKTRHLIHYPSFRGSVASFFSIQILPHKTWIYWILSMSVFEVINEKPANMAANFHKCCALCFAGYTF